MIVFKGLFYFFMCRCNPKPAMASSFLRFLYYTQRRTTFNKTPLYEWSARRRYLYLTKHNTHKRQTFMLLGELEPPFSAGERRQTARPLESAEVILVLLYVLHINLTMPNTC